MLSVHCSTVNRPGWSCSCVNTWHTFRDTHDGDDICTHCSVVVSTEAHLTFTLACPVPDCSSRMNPDVGCVFVPGRGEMACCVYCGRVGARDGTGIPTDDELDAIADEFLSDY